MAEPRGKFTFFCPHCNQKLSFLDGTVVKMIGCLHAESFSCTTMLYLPAKLGQYGAIVGEGVRIRDGARVEYECINRACARKFTTSYDDDLAEIKMVDEAGAEFAVAFSRVFGRRATFLVDFKEHTLVESFGEHAPDLDLDFDQPVNFFGD